MATFSNITIDDTLNSTLIAFSPPDCNGQGWRTTSGRGLNGNYSTCTDSTNVPSATLNFTGVAVYYRSPYFDGALVRFRLDGVLSDDIDLSTPPGAKFNASATRIVYSQTNLTNEAHTLQLFPSQNSTLNVDAFIVTTQAGGPPSVNGTTPSPANPLTANQGAISPKTTKDFGLAVGITVGSIALIILVVLFFFASRTRRNLNARFKWSGRQPPPLSNDRQLTYQSKMQQDVLGSRLSTPSPPPSPITRNTDLPMKSMTSLPLGSDASHDLRPWSPPTSNTSHRHLISSPSMRSNNFSAHRSPSPATIKFEPVRRA